MSDTTATDAATGDENATETTVTVAPEADGKPAEDTDELPEWARKKLDKANREAAKYRTTAREAADKAKTDAEAAVAEQLQALSDKHTVLVGDLEKANAELLKLKAAAEAEVPAGQLLDFASLLQGTTAEEIKASAEKAKRLLGSTKDRAVDPSQGAVGGAPKEAAPGFGRLLNAYSSTES